MKLLLVAAALAVGILGVDKTLALLRLRSKNGALGVEGDVCNPDIPCGPGLTCRNNVCLKSTGGLDE